ncbi:MAG: sensor histidine kinase, partial [Azospirillum sp.]|nr:sensor histidine kinase [Azospirillum sp.]
AERGSGLGLAIAAKLMAAMGGRLTVERAGAGGSTILVSLAAAPGGRDAG